MKSSFFNIIFVKEFKYISSDSNTFSIDLNMQKNAQRLSSKLKRKKSATAAQRNNKRANNWILIGTSLHQIESRKYFFTIPFIHQRWKEIWRYEAIEKKISFDRKNVTRILPSFDQFFLRWNFSLFILSAHGVILTFVAAVKWFIFIIAFVDVSRGVEKFQNVIGDNSEGKFTLILWQMMEKAFKVTRNQKSSNSIEAMPTMKLVHRWSIERNQI